MLNTMKINHLYQFEFITEFNMLDGVYKVLSIYSYNDLLNMEIDIKTETYDALGIDDSLFNTHLPMLNDASYIKISKLDTYPNVVYYVPDFIVSKEPVFSLVKAYDLGVAIKLGVWINKDQIDTIKTEIEQLVATNLGVSNNAVVYTINEILITEDEWNTIMTDRDINLSDIKTLYQKYTELQNEHNNLLNKISSLESIIVDISS